MLMSHGALFFYCLISDVPIFITREVRNIEVAFFIPVSYVTNEELNNHLFIPHERVKLCLVQGHFKNRNSFD